MRGNVQKTLTLQRLIKTAVTLYRRQSAIKLPLNTYSRNITDLERMEKGYYYYPEFRPASMHEKIVRVRKGVKGSDGKPLTQRDFAKYIEYPINKYVEAQKVDKWGRNDEEESHVDDELLDRLIFRCQANPYWLYDEECEASNGWEELDAGAVLNGDEPCIFAYPDVILRWIKEGKPRHTSWEDGRFDENEYAGVGYYGSR